jgi:hypothetical protein
VTSHDEFLLRAYFKAPAIDQNATVVIDCNLLA